MCFRSKRKWENHAARNEALDFHVPVRQGQLAEVVGRVTSTGRTSLTVEVELWAEDLLTGKRELCTEGSFVLVAVDEQGRPAPIVSAGPT